MVFPIDYPVAKLRGQPKGIKQVLRECNLWPAKGLHLTCKQCSRKYEDDPERMNCCARQIISLQPDFSEQQSLLEEAVIKGGYILERYPKFYCECNFIEQYWGFVKWEIRQSCNYNYADLLRKVLETLVSVPVMIIRKFACRSWRYMDAYDKSLEGRAAEWAVNKFKSHRCISENIERAIEKE
jgi:hypothetical protein